MTERRPTNSERRLRRITAEEPEQQRRRGILEVFRKEEQEQPDEDAPLAREGDDTAA